MSFDQPLHEPSSVTDAVIGLLVPFLAFYIGVLLRYKLRRALFPGDTLTFPELAMIGVLFSLTAVIPVLSLFQGQATVDNVKSYLMGCLTLIQAGFFMPESIARMIGRNRRRGARAESVRPLHGATPVT